MLRKLSIVSLVVTTMIVSSSQLLYCASSGKITGKITDATNNQPLAGANVILVGTSIGAVADFDGNFSISNVPAGSYSLKATYIGYETVTLKITLKDGEHLVKNLKLQPVGVKGEEVVVTAQASGQNVAINQQLSSDKIVNVISSARIQQLPDANAAESVGRLPGVSLIRSGGEATQIVIRGLQPKYNMIMIDGVEMPATDRGDRGTDLSMISSDMLSGIEVYKTVTPDMDAAVLGGVVNFQIREAKRTISGLPQIAFLAQGGYNNLQNAYNNYKFVGSIEDRFFNERFGVFAQAVVERVNLTSDQLGAGYELATKNYGVTNPIILDNLNLVYNPRDKRRYDGTVVMDYKLHDGKIDLMNFFSTSYTRTQSRSQTYDLQYNDIQYGTGYSPNTLNVITNLLSLSKNISSWHIDARLSHSYSENISRDNWSMHFLQSAAGLNTIPRGENPLLIAQIGVTKTNLNNMFFNDISTSNSFSKQRDITGAINLEKNVSISDLIIGTLKIGGQYQITSRWYSYDEGDGNLYNPTASDMRADIIKDFPWMAQPPYNIKSDGSAQFPITLFEDPGFSYGNFLSGNYMMGPATNFALLSQVISSIKKYGEAGIAFAGGPYTPNAYNSIANNYSGNEYKSAGYIMATVKIGSHVTVVSGVRYQGLETIYKAARLWNASAPNTYPSPYPHQDTTIDQYHDFWLPDVSLIYKPLSWLNARLAYTNTLAYPDFNAIVPKIAIFTTSVIWNNYSLKPARSQNYDLAFSFYNSRIGLLAVGTFLKQIDNLIFTQSSYITDPSVYPGLPNYTKGYQISTAINNPYRVNVWGMEFDWQTHFWYLPNPLKGLVLDVNYTHIFSSAKYPYTITKMGVYPTYITTHVDTFYTDRLINQPNDIVNLSIGYDYKDFSVVVSTIYQANVFNQTNFWPELRADKAKYLRWDLSAKQDLPWFGLEAFFQLNNINSESDIYLVRGSGFPNSEEDYGMTANLGLRWRL